MIKSFRILSGVLILALGITMVNLKTAYADMTISVDPPFISTREVSTKIYVDTGGAECWC